MSVTVMPQKSSQTRLLCSTCQVAWAWLGERECGDCLMVTRLALYLLTDPELRGREPTPWAMSVDQALDWVSGGVIHAEPRIVEVPMCPCGCGLTERQRDSFRERVPRAPRVKPKPVTVSQGQYRAALAWMGLAVLLAFTFGWLFGRSGC